jgi:hypothetical protein
MSRRQGPPKDADRAAEWLREHLEPGPAPSDTCAARGNEALNMSHRKDWWRDVVLKSMLGGKVRKRGFGDSQWYFTLPSHPWPFPGPGEEPPKEPVTTPAASSASSGPSAALVVYVPPPTEEAEEPEEPEEAESRRVGSVRGPSADLAGEPAEEPSKESPRTSSDSSGSSGSSASFAVDTQPRPTPSSEEPEEAEGGEEAGGESHRYGPDVSAADDEVVLDLGEIEHVDR